MLSMNVITVFSPTAQKEVCTCYTNCKNSKAYNRQHTREVIIQSMEKKLCTLGIVPMDLIPCIATLPQKLDCSGMHRMILSLLTSHSRNRCQYIWNDNCQLSTLGISFCRCAIGALQSIYYLVYILMVLLTDSNMFNFIYTLMILLSLFLKVQ